MRSGKFAFCMLVLTLTLVCRPASAVLIESWENSLDGWTTSPENSAWTSAGFSNTTGVTNQSFSWNLHGASGFTYGQLIDGPSTIANTTLLANSATVSLDVLAVGDFGFGQQWAMVVNNNNTGYNNIDPTFSHSPSIGSESTLTWTIPQSI